MKQEQVRHCVLVAETMSANFKSASCFLEIGDHPVIQLTLQWLADNDIEEVFLFYSTLKKEIEEYHAGNHHPTLRIHLHYVKPTEIKSVGDVLREVNFRNLISEDFLLLYGDSFTNLNLNAMVDNHFLKKKELKNVVLTTGMQRAISKTVYILNSLTREIMQVQADLGSEFSLNSQRINLNNLKKVEFRRDLMEVGVYICTVEVVKSFKQNHEYQSMLDFIVGMLTSDVYEEKINAYILPNDRLFYRLNKAHLYYAGYMSYVCGYLPGGAKTDYNVAAFNKLIKKGAKIAKTTRLSHNVLIGGDSLIAQNSSIEKSIVGKQCTIGKNVSLSHCIVLDNCSLADNANYSYSLIEKVNQTMRFHSFKDSMFEEAPTLTTKELFIETPSEEKPTFEEDIASLLTEEIDNDTLTTLQYVQHEHGKSPHDLTLQIMRGVKPQGIKDVEKFTNEWGPLLKSLHLSEGQLIDSFYSCCCTLESYKKAFHLFLQFMYHQDVISKEETLKWLTTERGASPTLTLCNPFLEKLQVDSSDQQDDN